MNGEQDITERKTAEENLKKSEASISVVLRYTRYT